MVKIQAKEVGETGYGIHNSTKAYRARASLPGHEGCPRSRSNFLEWRRLYGTHYYNSLHLLAAYFTKYPEDANKVVLSIKSGFKTGFEIDGNPEHVRDRVNNCNRILAGTKKIDIFEYARVPTNVDFFSVTLKELQKCVEEGLIGGIGLSEVTAATINKSAAIAKIDAVYSPLGRGMLTGQIKSADDILEGDFRRRFPRFQQENFHHNIELVQRLQEVSNRSRCTPGQLAIAWVRQAGKTVKRSPQIPPIQGATRKERVAENCKTVTLDKSALAHIEKVESIRIGTGSNMTVVIYLHIS